MKLSRTLLGLRRDDDPLMIRHRDFFPDSTEPTPG